MNKLKENFGFDFWQKFGKALMVVIAVMPAAGLMISIGKTIAMINPNAAPLVITGGFLEHDLPKIDLAIKDGSLKKNPVLLKLIEKLKENGKTCHLYSS